MPIYEFYCSDCNAIFSFFSKSVNTSKSPVCPACRKRKLKRMLSSFALTGKAVEPGASGDFPVDESKMEKAVASLAGEVEHMKGDDPRQAAKLMKKFADMTGMDLGGNMKDAISRLEAGEDPEKIEADMGDLMNADEQPFMPGEKGRKTRKSEIKSQPRRDTTLYEM